MKRKLLLSVGIFLACFVLLEVGLRVYFAAQVSSSVLFYGTPWHRRVVETGKDRANTSQHRVRVGSYTKYAPYQDLRDYDRETGEGFEVAINARGFRGPDFEHDKAPGVVRVVALGASSTFGYSARDDETYPYYLEQELERRDGEGRDFEVINLGIPHLESHQILALFENEGLALGPDVVTFYEGVNDAAGQASPVIAAARERQSNRRLSPLRRLVDATKDWLLVASVVDHRIPVRVERFSDAEFTTHAAAISADFLESVDLLRGVCREDGIAFLVATQQSKSLTIPREDLTGVTYAEEVERVRAELERSGSVPARAFYFLTHDALMRDLRAWAANADVRLVDVIAGLDAERDVLVSWVHVNARGNRMIAGLMAPEILAALAGH